MNHFNRRFNKLDGCSISLFNTSFQKLNLKYNTASMLEIESGSNDPCAYMLTATMIAIAKGGASVNGIAILIVRQVFLGLLFGGIIAVVSYLFLRRQGSP